MATLIAKGFVKQPDGSWSKAAPVVARIPAAEPESPVRHEPLGPVPGEEKSGAITVVRITAFRVRLQDADNNAGGCKYLIDGLRHAKIIADDSPDHIELVTRQVRVASKTDEGTEIVVEEMAP